MNQHLMLQQHFDQLAEEGTLRRLGVSFTRFIATLGPAPTSAPLLLATVLLSELEGLGHSCLDLHELADDPCSLLAWPQTRWQDLCEAMAALPTTADDWRAALEQCPQIWQVATPDAQQPLVLDGYRLYMRRYWRDETLVARAVAERAALVRTLDPDTVRHWLDQLFPPVKATKVTAQTGEAEPDWQKIACAVAVRSHVSIITGGPGTGKTYTVARLLALLVALAKEPSQLCIALAAPTGKAATRLKQSIDAALGGMAEQLGDSLPLKDLIRQLGAATTLHSLLGARPDTRRSRYHAGNLLDVDVLIVDEASMIHLEMMAALLDALPAHAMLVLLGDKDQLASVEAGAVLGDLCHRAEEGRYAPATMQYVQQACGETLPAAMAGSGGVLAQQTVMLRKSRRFGGPIGTLALAVNAGQAPAAREILLMAPTEQEVHWIVQARQENLLQLAIRGRSGGSGGAAGTDEARETGSFSRYLALLKAGPQEEKAAPLEASVWPALSTLSISRSEPASSIASHEALSPSCPEQSAPVAAHEAWAQAVLIAFDDFRLLCAVRDGDWGVTGINAALEKKLQSSGLLNCRGEWYKGRPVMVTRNDHSLGVFNGDVGITLPDPQRPGVLRVYFQAGEGVRSVLTSRLPHAETAYAMTIHKVQGSEFQHAAVVLPEQSVQVLTRELIYTGITRARQHFTLLTPNSALLDSAIQTRTRRASGLRGRVEAS